MSAGKYELITSWVMYETIGTGEHGQTIYGSAPASVRLGVRKAGVEKGNHLAYEMRFVDGNPRATGDVLRVALNENALSEIKSFKVLPLCQERIDIRTSYRRWMREGKIRWA